MKKRNKINKVRDRESVLPRITNTKGGEEDGDTKREPE